MKLLRGYLQNGKKQWQIYAYNEPHWEIELSIEQPNQTYYFFRWFQLPIEFALIGLYLPDLQGLYTFMPSIQIVIDPQVIYKFAMHFFDMPTLALDEVAVSLDASIKEEKKDIQDFLKQFYASSSVEEARQCYETWQLERSLWNEVGNKLLVIMNVYENEIFNYFKHKSLLGKLIGDIRLEEQNKVEHNKKRRSLI